MTLMKLNLHIAAKLEAEGYIWDCVSSMVVVTLYLLYCYQFNV